VVKLRCRFSTRRLAVPARRMKTNPQDKQWSFRSDMRSVLTIGPTNLVEAS
jgi:hypothetical protein